MPESLNGNGNCNDIGVERQSEVRRFIEHLNRFNVFHVDSAAGRFVRLVFCGTLNGG